LEAIVTRLFPRYVVVLATLVLQLRWMSKMFTYDLVTVLLLAYYSIHPVSIWERKRTKEVLHYFALTPVKSSRVVE
jgi:hypothetical protein